MSFWVFRQSQLCQTPPAMCLRSAENNMEDPRRWKSDVEDREEWKVNQGTRLQRGDLNDDDDENYKDAKKTQFDHFSGQRPKNLTRVILTLHFFVVHFIGTKKGPVCARKFTSPTRSSFIWKSQRSCRIYHQSQRNRGSVWTTVHWFRLQNAQMHMHVCMRRFYHRRESHNNLTRQTSWHLSRRVKAGKEDEQNVVNQLKDVSLRELYHDENGRRERHSLNINEIFEALRDSNQFQVVQRVRHVREHHSLLVCLSNIKVLTTRRNRRSNITTDLQLQRSSIAEKSEYGTLKCTTPGLL